MSSLKEYCRDSNKKFTEISISYHLFVTPPPNSENIRILPLFWRRLSNDIRILPSTHQTCFGQSRTLCFHVHFGEHLVVGLLDFFIRTKSTM